MAVKGKCMHVDARPAGWAARWLAPFKALAALAVAGMLGGCALPPALTVASYVGDGILMATTGKSSTDLGLSFAMGANCSSWHVVKEEYFCQDNVVAKPEGIPAEVAQDNSVALHQNRLDTHRRDGAGRHDRPRPRHRLPAAVRARWRRPRYRQPWRAGDCRFVAASTLFDADGGGTGLCPVRRRNPARAGALRQRRPARHGSYRHRVGPTRCRSSPRPHRPSRNVPPPPGGGGAPPRPSPPPYRSPSSPPPDRCDGAPSAPPSRRDDGSSPSPRRGVPPPSSAGVVRASHPGRRRVRSRDVDASPGCGPRSGRNVRRYRNGPGRPDRHRTAPDRRHTHFLLRGSRPLMARSRRTRGDGGHGDAVVSACRLATDPSL